MLTNNNNNNNKNKKRYICLHSLITKKKKEKTWCNLLVVSSPRDMILFIVPGGWAQWWACAMEATFGAQWRPRKASLIHFKTGKRMSPGESGAGAPQTSAALSTKKNGRETISRQATKNNKKLMH